MKNSLMLLALLCGVSTLFGQVQFGAKASIGSNMTSPSSKDYANVYTNKVYQISYEKSSPRKSIGLSLFAQNEKLFFTTDALYSSSNREFALLSTSFKKTNLDPAVQMKATQNDMRLVVNSGVKLGDFKIGVGPEISIVLSSEEDLSSIEDITKTESKYNTGFNFMLGYMLTKSIHIDLRHTYIFQDVSNEYFFQGVPMDMKKNAKYLELSLAAYF